MGFLSFLFRGAAERRIRREEKRVVSRGSEADLIDFARRLADEQPDHALAVLRRGSERHPASESIVSQIEDIEEAINRASIGVAIGQLEEECSPELLARVAELYRRVGDTAMAMKYGRQAIESYPNSGVGYRSVGRLYLEQFRLGQGSAQGINALRYLSRAHALDPRDSRTLLNLTETFILLRAPEAARKFLAPVQRAYPNDPTVIRYEERIRDLPNEETSQIQDLLLRHENRQSGEGHHEAPTLELPPEFPTELENLGDSLEGTLGIFLVDGNRRLLCRHCHFEADGPEDVGESIGLLADTARQNSQRMGIGEFKRLVVQTPEHMLMTETLQDEVMAVYFGDKRVKREEIEGLLTQLRRRLGVEPVEATA